MSGGEGGRRSSRKNQEIGLYIKEVKRDAAAQ
jgi:hypothetical protein